MPTFSQRSLIARGQLHSKLKIIVDAAILKIDFVILDAQRGRAEQEKAKRGGYSKAGFGDSAHNYIPAVAFDLAPYPISWEPDKFKALFEIIGYFDAKQGDGKGLAKELGVPLRWGADWNRDGLWNNENFRDWGHWELDPWREYAAKGRLIGD